RDQKSNLNPQTEAKKVREGSEEQSEPSDGSEDTPRGFKKAI
ncbi:hypothetical protein SAMN04488123_1101, partial [Natribacillus halophilus]